MNRLSRSVLLLMSLGFCVAGLITIAGDSNRWAAIAPRLNSDADPQTGYEFASGNLRQASFAEVEELVRADAACRFPNCRIELGSVRTERSGLVMNIVLFGPNHANQAFLYKLVPKNNSWQIAGTHRLWFVPASQIARGRRV